MRTDCLQRGNEAPTSPVNSVLQDSSLVPPETIDSRYYLLWVHRQAMWRSHQPPRRLSTPLTHIQDVLTSHLLLDPRTRAELGYSKALWAFQVAEAEWEHRLCGPARRTPAAVCLACWGTMVPDPPRVVCMQHPVPRHSHCCHSSRAHAGELMAVADRSWDEVPSHPRSTGTTQGLL